MQVFPKLGIPEDRITSEYLAIDTFNARPPHEFGCRETFDQSTVLRISQPEVGLVNGDVLVQLKLFQRGVVEETVKHIRLLVVMWRKDDVVNNMFENLYVIM